MDLRHDLALRMKRDERGVDEPVPHAFARSGLRCEGYAFVMADPAPRTPDEVDFDQTVEEALDSLPPDLREFISNVEVVVEEEPPPGRRLLGLYQGVPLTRRGSFYTGVLPDKITLFHCPLERRYGHDESLLRAQVRRVVLHEIAHHFGISDERLVELGSY
jgi:predicted Zn-dependent protease with MMP-like domain